MTYQVRLDLFEGPLDLLLYLIKKDNIDIYDIPVAEITAQYLDYLDIMNKLNLDVAGEFLVMSAALIYIKSEMLLPRPEIEGEEDPRNELVSKLLEYEKIKEVSKALREKEESQREVFTRNRITFTEEDYVIDASLFDLLDAFKKIVSRAEESFKEVIQEEIKIEDRIEYILDLLNEREWIDFSAMFAKLNMSRQLIIVTFMAILELVRQRKIFARQSDMFKEIRIYRKKADEKEEDNGQVEQRSDEADEQKKIIDELKEKKEEGETQGDESKEEKEEESE